MHISFIIEKLYHLEKLQNNTGVPAAARAAGSTKKAPQPPNKTTRPTRAVVATKNNFDGVKSKRIFKK